MSKSLLYKVNTKNINFSVNEMKSLIDIKGNLGNIKKVFKGKDIIIYSNFILIKSKSSLNIFLGFLKQKLLGVSQGYYIELCLVGLGYRFIIIKNVLLLRLGFSHYIKCELSKNVQYIGYKDKLVLYGLDLEDLNMLGYKIRSLKIPDSYKGKGIQYKNELLKLKVGKQK